MQQKVVLFASYDQALEYRKALAAESPKAAFGVQVSTFSAWLKDAWELFGDGRGLVSAAQRSFAVHWLLENEPAAQALELTDGGIALICRFISQAVGLPQLDDALAGGTEGLSPQENAVLNLVEPYRALLRQHGLVEPGDALAAIAGRAPAYGFELSEGVEPGAAFDWFVKATSSECVRWEAEEPRITPAAPGCKTDFLFASGPSCEDALVSQYVQALVASGAKRVLVVGSRSLAVYGALSQALQGRAQCVLRASIPFAETVFGRAYLAVREFVLEEAHDPYCLMDYFASPFSGVGAIDAANICSQVRGNRLLSYEDLHALAHLVSPNFDFFEELVSDSDASLLLDHMLDVAEELKGMDAAEKFEQQVAIMGLRGVYEAARVWEVSPADFLFALNSLSVTASRSCGSGPAVVEVADYSRAATIVRGKYDAVVLCDLDARYHSAGESHNALVTLLQKLGIKPEARALASERRTFQQLKARAAATFACERVLNAGGDEDIYPSFVLDEFMECLAEEGEEANEFGVPAHLQQNMVLRDEGGAGSSYAANYDPAGQVPAPLVISQFEAGEVAEALKPELCLAHAPENKDQLVLSPSAIEDYINCPYRWFVSRTVRPNAPDEELGPLERGSFVHGVFEEFYKRVPEALGEARITPRNLADAQNLLGQVFDEQLEAQPLVEGNVRYLPLTPTERADASHLRATLLENLAVQSLLMIDFVPGYLEFSIEPGDGVDYAGVRLRGRVDRIDVNKELGQFVVLDYKGSVAGHDAGWNPDGVPEENPEEHFVLPSKIQALIYAQGLRRLGTMGHPVGALYLSYKAKEPKELLAGSYNPNLLDVHWYTKKQSVVEMNFEAYLDFVEGVVREKLKGLVAGDIRPNPLCADSCKYCPAKNCGRRL